MHLFALVSKEKFEKVESWNALEFELEVTLKCVTTMLVFLLVVTFLVQSVTSS